MYLDYQIGICFCCSDRLRISVLVENTTFGLTFQIILLAMRPWPSYFASLSLSLLIWKIGSILSALLSFVKSKWANSCNGLCSVFNRECMLNTCWLLLLGNTEKIPTLLFLPSKNPFNLLLTIFPMSPKFWKTLPNDLHSLNNYSLFPAF